MTDDVSARFELVFEPGSHRRFICDHSVIIHCHHYNARLQQTIESAAGIDGKGIFVSSAEAVFVQILQDACYDVDDPKARCRIAEALYEHLGFGIISLCSAAEGLEATSSHFVEGFAAGFGERKTPVCSMTEGFLAAALYVISGRVSHVRETQCMIEGHSVCRFEIDDARETMSQPPDKHYTEVTCHSTKTYIHSPNVDEQTIINAVVGMPIYGNDEGLIPIFNVYLANMPADFYNLVCIRFLEAMSSLGLGTAARNQLIYDAETCGLNTFRGIRASAEWDSLIAPMIHAQQDELFAMIAISNSLGWGNWHIYAHTAAESVALESLNAYEAHGMLELRSVINEPACLMLTGVSAGIMELVYGFGSLDDRFGQYLSREGTCLACRQRSCTFEVEGVV